MPARSYPRSGRWLPAAEGGVHISSGRPFQDLVNIGTVAMRKLVGSRQQGIIDFNPTSSLIMRCSPTACVTEGAVPGRHRSTCRETTAFLDRLASSESSPLRQAHDLP